MKLWIRGGHAAVVVVVILVATAQPAASFQRCVPTLLAKPSRGFGGPPSEGNNGKWARKQDNVRKVLRMNSSAIDGPPFSTLTQHSGSG